MTAIVKWPAVQVLITGLVGRGMQPCFVDGTDQETLWENEMSFLAGCDCSQRMDAKA
jgi:hypothetical protein